MATISAGARRLGNYVAGEWVQGTGSPTELFHAVTGDKVAEASTGGIDRGTKIAPWRTWPVWVTDCRKV